MDQSQLICDEEMDDMCRDDSGSASPPTPRILERDDECQGFSTMVRPDFRASIPGYPAPARKGMKRPMVFESDSDEEQPDLGDYFSGWDICRRDQIHLCRAYASYLAVQDKSINKK